MKLVLVLLAAFSGVHSALAMDLDWSGQFRAESHWVKNYSLGNGANYNPGGGTAGGYSIRGGGSETASFQTLFLRLRPKVIVNDNVYIKTELWFGDPAFGFFGDSAPYSSDRRQYYSNQSRGSSVSAQRLWLELLSDVGTVQVGRAPLQWGLGLVWNAGDGIFDRYQSTGDLIRLVSKFGSFSFVPTISKYSMGNNVGGAYSTASGGVVPGGGGVSDYSLAIKYENPDEDFEGGVNFIKRISGSAQELYLGPGAVGAASQPAVGANFNTWSIFSRKKVGKLTLAGELPITAGDVGGAEYSTWALATETQWAANDSWDLFLKAGHASGQPNLDGATTRSDKYRAFFFNPNYRIALIMFNYQLNSFAGPNTQNGTVATASGSPVAASQLKSPFDNPIVNANYISLGSEFKVEKWSFHGSWTYAKALETASSGKIFFNTWDKTFHNSVANQSSSLGFEFDLGTTLKWDDNFLFGMDFGVYKPGDYYKFSNVAGVENKVDPVLALVLRAGLTF